jgi:hypothetical protein
VFVAVACGVSPGLSGVQVGSIKPPTPPTGCGVSVAVGTIARATDVGVGGTSSSSPPAPRKPESWGIRSGVAKATTTSTITANMNKTIRIVKTLNRAAEAVLPLLALIAPSSLE